MKLSTNTAMPFEQTRAAGPSSDPMILLHECIEICRNLLAQRDELLAAAKATLDELSGLRANYDFVNFDTRAIEAAIENIEGQKA